MDALLVNGPRHGCVIPGCLPDVDVITVRKRAIINGRSGAFVDKYRRLTESEFHWFGFEVDTQ